VFADQGGLVHVAVNQKVVVGVHQIATITEYVDRINVVVPRIGRDLAVMNQMNLSSNVSVNLQTIQEFAADTENVLVQIIVHAWRDGMEIHAVDHHLNASVNHPIMKMCVVDTELVWVQMNVIVRKGGMVRNVVVLVTHHLHGNAGVRVQIMMMFVEDMELVLAQTNATVMMDGMVNNAVKE